MEQGKARGPEPEHRARPWRAPPPRQKRRSRGTNASTAFSMAAWEMTPARRWRESASPAPWRMPGRIRRARARWFTQRMVPWALSWSTTAAGWSFQSGMVPQQQFAGGRPQRQHRPSAPRHDSVWLHPGAPSLSLTMRISQSKRLKGGPRDLSFAMKRHQGPQRGRAHLLAGEAEEHRVVPSGQGRQTALGTAMCICAWDFRSSTTSPKAPERRSWSAARTRRGRRERGSPQCLEIRSPTRRSPAGRRSSCRS